MKNSTLFVSAAALILAGAASASTGAHALQLAIAGAAFGPAPTDGFTGAYAPGTWTVTTPGGGSSAVFSPDGQRLTITGLDGIAGNIDVTHAVVGSGDWSFNWTYSSLNTTPGFDNGFYLHNGVAVFLATTSVGKGPVSGSESIAVTAGDIIGWRVDSVDGLFGPGILNIDRFEIPAPGALALLGLAGLAGSRRRA